MPPAPIRTIGTRPHLFLGGEPKVIFGFGTLAGTVVTGSGLSPLPSLIAIAGWLAALWMARRAARIDPYYFRIRYRLRKYDRYWPARPTPFGARKNKMKGV